MDGSGGELWAMEVNPEEALEEFRDTLKSSLGNNNNINPGGGGMGASMGLPDLKAELSDMLSGDGLADTPGADEVVALTKVVSFLQDGVILPNGQALKFDRVVLDTAPTGHTMRMLTLPEFLIQFVQKVKAVRDKAGAFEGMMGGMMGGSSGSSSDAYDNVVASMEGEGSTTTTAIPPDKLAVFENRMRALSMILHDGKLAEFAVVTIPTEVAVSETTRLLDTLEKENIACRRLVVNQMISGPVNELTLEEGEGDGSEEGGGGGQSDVHAKAYLDRLRAGQAKALSELAILAKDTGVELATVPYFGDELRTVFGLRMISMTLQL
jgi:arsenite-transporting ATPase